MRTFLLITKPPELGSEEEPTRAPVQSESRTGPGEGRRHMTFGFLRLRDLLIVLKKGRRAKTKQNKKKINHNLTSLENKQSGVNLSVIFFFATPHMYCAFSVTICVYVYVYFFNKMESPCI